MGVVYFSIIPTFEPSRYCKCWIVCFCNKNVFSFTEEGCRNKKDIVEMEPGEYLAAVCRESDGDIRDTYREIKDLMKKESKQFDSDIYSLSIVNVIDPNEEHKYLKYIFAKVKQI